MKLRLIRDLRDLRNKRVVLRIDANVPIKDGKVVEDFRLKKALPTIEFLTGRGAVVVIIAHLGRPRGKNDRAFTMAPIAKRLSQLYGHVVTFVPDTVGTMARRAVASAVPGQVFLLENLRFNRGEESNSGSFAKKLAALGDIYVNDGFGVSHRAHASVSAITRFLPSYAGFLMEREIFFLDYARRNPARPSVAMLGGSKLTTKIKLIKELAKKYDLVLLGGGLVNAILTAKGFAIGASTVDKDSVREAKTVLKIKNVDLPVDVVVGQPDKKKTRVHVVPIATDEPFAICRKPEVIADVGPRTILAWSGILKRAKTIVWNGPLGVFEDARFAHATVALARVVASRSKGKAMGLVGGGETVEALNQTHMANFVDHVSTGGGAMLEYLEGRVLPGVKPLYGKTK